MTIVLGITTTKMTLPFYDVNCLFVLLVFNDTFSTNRLHHALCVWNIYCVGPWGKTQEHRQTKRKKNTHKHSLPPGLCGGNLLTTLRCPQRGFSSQSLSKYWQLNQSNQHTSTYSRIQQQTKNPYYATIHNEYAQENPRINWHDRRKVTPRRSPAVHSTTHTEAVHCQGVLLGVFHPCLWPLKALGSTLGRVAKPLISPVMPVPPYDVNMNGLSSLHNC